MSALTIVQSVCSRLGLSIPTAVFSSTDAQVIQLRNLMNEEGQELRDWAAWTKLQTEKTFTTTAAAIQASAVPTDFGWYINETLWNRTRSVQYAGPTSESEWQAYQASITQVALPNGVFRFRGGNLLIYPSPTAGDNAAYEYVSLNWAQTSGNVGLSAMTADTDTAILDEKLIALGIRWRFLKSKGLDYAEDFRTYELQKAQSLARDGGKKRISLSGGTTQRYRGNIPEGNWNL